jgi:hypothetical protein
MLLLVGLVQSGIVPAAKTYASGLTIVPLDSTLHVQWTPTANPAAAWQMLVIREMDGTLQQSKVVAKTANAAQANGLVPGRSYQVAVYDIDSAGRLNLLGDGTAATDPQRPMCNATFFENFNEDPGNLLSDYMDVRTDESVSDPDITGVDKRLVFNNENHFHTQLVGTTGHIEMYVRPRVPFDLSGERTGTIQFEVDLPPAQRGHGKWFGIMLSPNIPSSAADFGDNTDTAFDNSVGFLMRSEEDALEGNGLNRGRIVTNIGGVERNYNGTTPHFSATNVRVPIVIKVSRTFGELWVNGQLAVHADFASALPFTSGYLTLTHRSYYSQRWFNGSRRAPTMVDQLIHWDTFQYDGPTGNTGYNPIVRTYIQSGCSGTVHMMHNYIEGCPEITLGTYRFTFNITDNVTAARSARLLLNGGDGRTISVNVNGRGETKVQNTGSIATLSSVAFNPAWLVQGQNVITLTGSNADIAQIEAEVVYNLLRVIATPAPHSMPMLNVTANNFRIDRITGDPTVMSATTGLYSLGADVPFNYTVQVLTNSPWLSVSPASGQLTSPVSGGAVVPMNMRVDFGTLGSTNDDGVTAILKVSNGIPNSMPAYIGLMVVNDGSSTRPQFITSYPPFITSFNKATIPNYNGCPRPGGTP